MVVYLTGVCVCFFLCVCVLMYVLHMEARGWHQCASQLLPPPLFWGKVSHWMQNSLTWLDKMANWLHAYFSSPVLGLQTHSWHFVWLPDIQTQVFFALLTEPSPNKHPCYVSSVRDSMSRNCPCPNEHVASKVILVIPSHKNTTWPDPKSCSHHFQTGDITARETGKCSLGDCYQSLPWG